MDRGEPVDRSRLDRRAFVRATGTAGVALAAGLGGCLGDSGDGGDGGSGGSGGGSDTGPITFGQPVLFSGGLKFVQPPVSAAADVALRDVNEAGGPLDRELRLRRRDTGRDPATAREVLDQHVNQDEAAVVTGFTSTGLVPMWEELQETRVPVVSMYAGTRFLDDRGGDGGTPGDTSDDGWVWRTNGTDSQHAAGAAVHARRTGAETVGVLHGTAAGSRDWADAFLDAVRAVDGLSAGPRVEVSEGEMSYRADLGELYGGDVDTWGLGIETNSAVSVLRQWSDGQYAGRVVLSNRLKNARIVEELGESLADREVLVSVPAIDGPRADAFRSAFGEYVSSADDYGSDLAPNHWAAAAYDAVTVGALAVHAAGSTDYRAIQRHLGPVAREPGREVSTFAEGKAAIDDGESVNYVGAQTRVDFDDTGDVFNRADVYELGAGGFEPVAEVSGDRIEAVLEAVDDLDGTPGDAGSESGRTRRWGPGVGVRPGRGPGSGRRRPGGF